MRRPADEAGDLADQDEHRRAAQRMGLHRRGDLAPCQVRRRVPESTPGTERQAQRVERAQAQEMVTTGIHRGHRQEPHRPHDGLERQCAEASAHALKSLSPDSHRG